MLDGFTPTIFLHGLAALLALVIGCLQLVATKGTTSHRIGGYVWLVLMMCVAISSFWIHTINTVFGFSVIHLLSIFVIVSLPIAVLEARRGNITRHRKIMRGNYIGGLVIAGFFTMAPGRLLGRLIFGW